MSDGRIKIDIEIDGKPIDKVESDFRKMESTAKKSATGTDEVSKSLKGIDSKKTEEASDGMKGLGDTSKRSSKDVDGVSDSLKGVDGKPVKDTADDMDKLDNKTQKGEKSMKDFVVALGLVKVAAMAFNVLADSMDGAINRFDTFEKFPKVLESMGFEASHSQRAMEQMGNAIEGLPTTLDEMVSLTQKFVNITGDLDYSVETAEALNNAMLASGSSAADASRGIEQYSQMLQNGEPDMQSWKSVNETMGYGIKRTAEEMLGAGASSRDLYDAIKGGEITMDEMNDKIIELGGSTGELGVLAQENSKGIATSFTNLKNSAVKGMANVLKSMDQVSQKVTGNTIAENLDGMKVAVNKTFDTINKTIIASTPVIEGVAVSFGVAKDAADYLSPAIIGVASAYLGLKIISGVTSMMNTSNAAIKASTIAMTGLEGVTIALTEAKAIEVAAIKVSDGATKAEIATQLASSGVITAKTALIGIMTGQITLAQLATVLWTGATTVLNGALALLMANPVVAFIAVFTAGVAAAVKISKSWNEELLENNKEMRNMTGEVKENNKATNDNIRKRTASIDKLQEETEYNKKMVDSLEALANGEKATAGTKKEISESMGELMRLYPDLNLQYDENTNRINQSAEAIKSQIAAYDAYDKVKVIQDTMKKSTEELTEAELEQSRIAADLKEVRQQKADTDWYSMIVMHDLNKTEKELMAQEEANGERRKSLANEHQSLIEQQEVARQQALQAQIEAVREAGLQYDFLSDTQKKMVDTMKGNYQDLVTSASSFTSDLSFELDMTGQEFIDFVANNQRVMSEWGNNMKTLSERGVNEGFLTQLQNMGPEGAKYAQLAVNMSSEELKQLNSVFGNAEPVAKDTWEKAYGMENAEQAVKDLVFKSESTFAQSFAESGINELAKNAGKQNMQSMADGINENKTVVDEAVKQATQPSEDLGGAIKGQFNTTGQFIPQGLAEGIEQNKEAPKTAIQGAAQATIDAANSAFEVHSPSRVFMSIGDFIVQGLAGGIDKSKDIAVKAMDNLSRSMIESGEKLKSDMGRLSNELPRQFDSLPSQMDSIGQQAMQGLTNGIYAGQGGPLAAAQSVADRIKSTIQNALDIHSPSRWMRDKIGRFIPQGIALGIEDDAGTVLDSMDNLNRFIMKGITAESALNIGRGVSFAGATQSSNNTTNNYQSDFEGFMRGAVFNVRDDNDIPKLAKEIFKEWERFNPNRTPGMGGRY
ncbi:tape measure protein [Vagococcus fluvialis]|uniref:Tape measure protein n=1 Tax=Vagococcus fluvialis TaxID=2738 RepID=A0A7X6D7D7_9ENTE|nr:tape measure protein [Vagococcus fluvialis]NKC67177.1 tape measure protein [Vagococcus fluvialis]